MHVHLRPATHVTINANNNECAFLTWTVTVNIVKTDKIHGCQHIHRSPKPNI